MIVDDAETIRKELASFLESCGYKVSVLENFSHVVQDILQEKPDLILLDINLPYADGYHICRELRKKSDIPILVVTSRNSEVDELMSMNLGADDFIAKPFDMDVLTAKIQAILRRTYSFGTPGNVLEYNGVVLSPSRCTLTWNGNDIDLTKNELRILEILMEHAGKVVSRDAIMTKLWESDSFIDDNTLTVNITRLRRKLEKEGLKEFIITKKGLGYMV